MGPAENIPGRLPLQGKRFVQVRHLDLGFGQAAGQGLHGFHLAMNKKGALGIASPGVPVEQFLLIGMGGEAADGVDFCVDLDFLLQHSDHFRTLDNLAGQRTLGRITDKNHRSFPAPEVVAEVVADPAAGAHAGTGNDDRAPNMLQGHGLGGVADDFQPGQLKGIAAGGKVAMHETQQS